MIKKLILLICITFNCLAQAPVKLSGYEKRWAFLHPFAALKVKHIGKQATRIYRENAAALLDSYSNGGKLDAFRHVFFMAAFAQKVGLRKLRKLGVAHEKGNYRQFLRSAEEEGEIPDSLSSVMDLQNNELGFKLGAEHKNLGLDMLKAIIIESIRRGEAVIIKRNKAGAYLDCSDRPLQTPFPKKRWNISKCLVASDYVY